MPQRLVWNFEFAVPLRDSNIQLTSDIEDTLKWEARFFWPHWQVIILQLFDKNLLELSQYQYKQKDDYYYLLKNNCNIKSRHDTIVYKPLLKEAFYSLGFSAKLTLEEKKKYSDIDLSLETIYQYAPLQVKKEAFIYKCATIPPVKIELSKIEIKQTTYFSLCIEGRSQKLVESISALLLGKQPTNDYVRFLKSIAESHEHID